MRNYHSAKAISYLGILKIRKIFIIIFVSKKYYKKLASYSIFSPKNHFCHVFQCSLNLWKFIAILGWKVYNHFNYGKNSLTTVNIRTIKNDYLNQYHIKFTLAWNTCFALEFSDLLSVALEILISSDFLIMWTWNHVTAPSSVMSTWILLHLICTFMPGRPMMWHWKSYLRLAA